MTAVDRIYCLILKANVNLSLSLTSSSRPVKNTWTDVAIILKAHFLPGCRDEELLTSASPHYCPAAEGGKTSSMDSNFHSGKSSVSVLGAR